MEENSLISPKEASKLLGVSYKTLWKWYKKGLIGAVKLPSGRLRYHKRDIEKIVKGEFKSESGESGNLQA